MGAVYIQFVKPQTIPPITQNTIGLLTIDAPVTEFDETSFMKSLSEKPSITMHDLRIGFQKIIENPYIKSLVIHIHNHNAFGLAHAQDMRDMIGALQNAGKTVHIYTDTFGDMSNATVSYYLASAADAIHMQNLGQIYMLGFASERPFLKSFLDKNHITFDITKRKDYKSYPEMFTESDFSKFSHENTKNLLDDLWAQITQNIANNRKIPLTVVQNAFQKSPLTHVESLESGFINDQSSLHKIMNAEKNEHAAQSVKSLQYIAKSQKITQKKPKKTYAVIYLNGGIERDSGKEYETKITDLKTVDLIKRIAKNPNIKGVVLRIDSPGGSPSASESIWQAIQYYKDTSKNPVVISMGNVCASGGYYIATSGDKIIAQPGTITGSIGVFLGKPITEKAWNHYGVQFGIVKSNDNADMLSTRQNFTPEQKKRINISIDHIYQAFLQKVATSRNLDIQNLDQNIAGGRVWTGRQALQNGLVDELGGVDVALKTLNGLVNEKALSKDKTTSTSAPTSTLENSSSNTPTDDFDVVYYPEKETFFQKLLKSFTNAESIAESVHDGLSLIKSALHSGVRMESNFQIQ